MTLEEQDGADGAEGMEWTATEWAIRVRVLVQLHSVADARRIRSADLPVASA